MTSRACAYVPSYDRDDDPIEDTPLPEGPSLGPAASEPDGSDVAGADGGTQPPNASVSARIPLSVLATGSSLCTPLSLTGVQNVYTELENMFDSLQDSLNSVLQQEDDIFKDMSNLRTAADWRALNALLATQQSTLALVVVHMRKLLSTSARRNRAIQHAYLSYLESLTMSKDAAPTSMKSEQLLSPVLPIKKSRTSTSETGVATIDPLYCTETFSLAEKESPRTPSKKRRSSGFVVPPAPVKAPKRARTYGALPDLTATMSLPQPMVRTSGLTVSNPRIGDS